MSLLSIDRVDRASKLPLYHQLYVILRTNIMSGDLQPGDVLPSETEFVEHYEISRTTVRQALDMLVNEGLIVRRQGQGTFVAHPTLAQSASHIVSFTEDMLRRGLEPDTQVLTSHLVQAPVDIAEALKIEPGEDLAYLERLRLADSEPISLEQAYLVHAVCPGLLESDYARTSLREALLLEYGIRLARAEQKIRAVSAPSETAKRLAVANHAPLLFIERVSFSLDDVPIEFLRVFHRGDRYALHNELRG